MKEIKINTPYITLGQLLKMTNIASSGGMAKMLLLEMEVLINNEKDNRRGRKLYKDDIIKISKKDTFKIV